MNNLLQKFKIRLWKRIENLIKYNLDQLSNFNNINDLKIHKNPYFRTNIKNNTVLIGNSISKDSFSNKYNPEIK
jgi:hypothetical protein